MTGAFSKVFAEGMYKIDAASDHRFITSAALCSEGLRGLFAGVTVTALIGAPSTAVYFGAYEVLKTSVRMHQ